MHIEPGIVSGAKIILSYGTAAMSIGLAARMLLDNLKTESKPASLVVRSVVTTALVFCFFQVLPHHAVGVSEVHLILGSTLLLMFGAGPAAVGLALGLLIQGLFFAPFDLPQYGMNVTTLLVPLWAMSVLAKRIVPANTAYKDVTYRQAFLLSTSYQGGIVVWVAFWSLYGGGFGTENLVSVASFGVAYLSVILVEPLIDLAVLGMAKALSGLPRGLFARRLFVAE